MKSKYVPLLKKILMESWLQILIGLLFFILLLIRPFSGDDWAWGGRIGLARLESWFQNYSGRYMGNLTVLVLTRLPVLLRGFIQICIIGLGVYTASKLLNRNKLATAAFIMLMICIPHDMFAQTYGWLSGFANYITSAVYAVCIVYLAQKIFFGHQFKKLRIILICIMILLCQTILETITIYFIFVLFFFSVLYLILHKKFNFYLILMFISSILGATYMFSNSIYRRAALIDTVTYQKITLFNGIESIKYYSLRYLLAVSRGITPNFLLNLIICVLMIIIALCFGGKIGKFFTAFFGVSVGFLLYFQIDTKFENIFTYEYATAIRSILDTLFYVALCIAVFLLIREKQWRYRLLFPLLSQIFIVSSLLPASPNPIRCFFITYMFFAFFISQLCVYVTDILNLKINPLYSDYTKKITSLLAIVTVVVISCYLCMQYKTNIIVDYRSRQIDFAIQHKHEIIYLPEVPYPDYYFFGGNPSAWGSRWINIYKDFHEVPANIEVVFVEFNEWKEKYSLLE